MNTNPDEGTGPSQLVFGAAKWVRDAGYHVERLEYQGWRVVHPKEIATGESIPRLEWLKKGMHDNAAVWINVGWYRYTPNNMQFERIGGHWVTLVGYGRDERGNKNPSYIIVHDPGSRAGTAPAHEYVRTDQIPRGTLVGNKTGLPRKADGYLALSRGMHISSRANGAILDAAIVMKLKDPGPPQRATGVSASEEDTAKIYKTGGEVPPTGRAITEDMELPKGLIIQNKWPHHNKWSVSKVIQELPDGKIEFEVVNTKKHYQRARSTLSLAPDYVEQPFVSAEELAAFRRQIAGGSPSSVTSAFRTWKDTTGKFSIEAKYLRMDGDNVVLRRKDNDGEIKVPRSRLSKPDQRFLSQQMGDSDQQLPGPPYAPDGELTCIDLQPKANKQLTAGTATFPENNLEELPRGEHTFAGVRFRIGDSFILLAGGRQREMPQQVDRIVVDGKFTRLYVLHGTHYEVDDGTLIGQYQVNYEDDTTETAPIVYGEDVRNWWTSEQTKSVRRAAVGWEGTNAATRQNNRTLRLYLTVWKNPYPDKKIVHIDFLSANTDAAPFCVAMTVEAATGLSAAEGALDSEPQ